ncbi:MAG TPA: hypothetical protein VIF88_10315 [Methylocystis sp.]
MQPGERAIYVSVELRRFLDWHGENGDPETYRCGDQSRDDDRNEAVDDRPNDPASGSRMHFETTFVSLIVSCNLRRVSLKHLFVSVQVCSCLWWLNLRLNKLRLFDPLQAPLTLIRSCVGRGLQNDLLRLFLAPGVRRSLDAFRSPAFIFSLFHSGESLLHSGKPFLQSGDRPLAAQRLAVARRRLGWRERGRMNLLSYATTFFSTTLFLPLFERDEGPVAEKGLAHLSLQSFDVRIRRLAWHCQYRKIPYKLSASSRAFKS